MMLSSHSAGRSRACWPVAGLVLTCIVAGCSATSAGAGAPTSAIAARASTATPAGPTGQTPAPSPTTDVERAVAAVEETVAQTHRNVGVQVVLRVGGEVRTVVIGPADRAAKRSVTPDDRFAIASITKSMVATAVMEYVAAGKVGLDDPAARWVPDLKAAKRITVRQLLAHRAGLHAEDSWFDQRNTDHDLVRMSAEHTLDFAPGSDGAYSNVGYVALGLLLERVSGKPLAEVLREKVFRPAGMSSTSLGGNPTVLGYEGDAVLDPGLGGPDAAAGGVVSTAADVDRFYRSLYGGRLVPTRFVRMMTAATGTVPFGVGDYGLGLWTWPMRCADGLGHSGSLAGFSSKAWTMPDKDRSVVVLVNESDGDDHLTAAIADNALCA